MMYAAKGSGSTYEFSGTTAELSAPMNLLHLDSDVVLHILRMLPVRAAAAAAASSMQMATLLRPVLAAEKVKRAAMAEERLRALSRGWEEKPEEVEELRWAFHMFAHLEDGSNREVIKQSELKNVLYMMGLVVREAETRDMLGDIEECRMPGESSRISFDQFLAAMGRKAHDVDLSTMSTVRSMDLSEGFAALDLEEDVRKDVVQRAEELREHLSRDKKTTPAAMSSTHPAMTSSSSALS